jgi:hypothetical protein
MDYLQTIGATNEAARAKTLSALAAQVQYIYNELVSVGFPRSVVTTYAISVMLLESNWMTSNLANVDNNYSGIKFVSAELQRATPGIMSPEGNRYAHYNTFKDWARDFLRVLSLNRGGMGRPIDARNAAEFIDRMRANGYFTASNYHTAFNAALRKVSEAASFTANQNQQWKAANAGGQNTYTYTPGEGLTSNEKFNFEKWATNMQNWARNNPGTAIASGVGILVGLSLLKKALD